MNYLRTYLLTPRSRVLLEKLTGFAANQEIPRILWDLKVHYRTHKRRLELAVTALEIMCLAVCLKIYVKGKGFLVLGGM